MRSRSKVTLSTETDQGTGASPAQLFAVERAGVLLFDWRGSPGLEVAEEIAHGGEAPFVLASVKHEAVVADAMRTKRHTLESIDNLVSVAKIDRKGHVDRLAIED